jgi:hypothetical protein
MATQRILDFLATRRPAGPCLVVDLDVVADNFNAFEKALPDSKIYYAVKANPAPEILRLLASSGLVLRHRFGRGNRDGDGCRRACRAHLLRQHHQEGARHSSRL